MLLSTLRESYNITNGERVTLHRLRVLRWQPDSELQPHVPGALRDKHSDIKI
jgi:hypothetical protein